MTSFMDGPSADADNTKKLLKKETRFLHSAMGPKSFWCWIFHTLMISRKHFILFVFISAFSALVALSENLDFLKVTFFKKASTGWTRHRKFKKFMSLRITDLQKFWCDFIKPHWEISRIWPRSCLDYLL